MGYLQTQTYDPDDLDIPYDDFEEIDEWYESYQEYDAYMPDMTRELKPLTRQTDEACAKARAAMDEVTGQLVPSVASESIAQLLLYDEAVSTSQAENYPVTCASMLEANAAMSETSMRADTPERVAMHAVDALTDFVVSDSPRITLDEICRANEMFARDSPRAEWCGELRDRPVWIGRSLFDAIYVAPPADSLDDYMRDLLHFMNDRDDGMDPIAKAAISHVQFITVHPFEDGNGRTGRALSQRILRQSGVLQTSCLPTTAVMVAQHGNYVDHIQDFRSLRGPADPNRFVTFFANCCEAAAKQTLKTAERIEGMLGDWHSKVPTHDADAHRAMEAFAACPAMTRTMLSSQLGKDSLPAIHTLMDAGIVEQGRSRLGGVDVYRAPQVILELETAQRMRSLPIQAATGSAARQRRVQSIRENLSARTPIATDFDEACDDDMSLPY